MRKETNTPIEDKRHLEKMSHVGVKTWIFNPKPNVNKIDFEALISNNTFYF